MKSAFWRHSMVALVFLCSFFTQFASAAAVDGEPQIDWDRDDGLYVWRSSDGAFHARAVAASGAASFEGTLESPSGMSAFQSVSIESADSLASTDSALEMSLTVWPGGMDGVDLPGPFGQGKLCLRLTGDDKPLVYLGQSKASASVPVDLTGNGACDASAESGADGLYILRRTSSSWEVRLKSDSEAQIFAGTFSATKSITGFSEFSLEASDEAVLVGGSTIETNMQTWPGGTDGFNFSVSNASVCVEDATGSSTPVYLGSSMDSAVPVSTPVDIAGLGGCDQTTPVQPIAPSGRKSHMGHYVRLLQYNDRAAAINEAAQPGVTGIMKHYDWKDLEPTEGNYNFSEIEADLQQVAGLGLQLIVLIGDKSFKSIRPTPDYLAGSQHTRKNRAGGYTAIRWSPFVITRMKALISAIGNRFDSRPHFEGISTQETAPSLDSAVLDATAYTPEKYRAAYIDILRHASAKLPTSRVFFFVNFFPRKNPYMADIIEAVKDLGIVAGGPDVMPDETSIQTHLYPILRSYAGQLPLFGQVEPACFHHHHEDASYPTKYWTMGELFRYARDNLSVNYMFWTLYPKSLYSDSYDFYDALPVIERNPQFN